jgi:hypothetical protein
MTKHECIRLMNKWESDHLPINPWFCVGDAKELILARAHAMMRYVDSLPGVISAEYEEATNTNHIRLAPVVAFVWAPGISGADAARMVHEILAANMTEVTP